MFNHTPNQSITAKHIPVIFFDGNSPEKSQPGAAAAIVSMPHGKRYTVSRLVSFSSKGEAEYMGLIIGLKKAQGLKIPVLEVKGNSELVFNQVNGLTAVTDERLERLHRKVIQLIQSFDHVSLEWITPEKNCLAQFAVQRCVREALNNQKEATSVGKAIAQLIKKGDHCQDEDYRQLKAPNDQWIDLSLAKLRDLIPLEIQDAIALQWKGGEEDLAQMYRWYLRGLPPNMASRKVNLDQVSQDPSAIEKLPWEEALIEPPNPLPSHGASEDLLISLLSELDHIDSEPLKPSLSENINLQIAPSIEIPLSQPETNSSHPQEPLEVLLYDIEPSIDNKTHLFNSVAVESEDKTVVEPHLMTLSADCATENQKDTLPSKSEITEIIEMINHLGTSDKMTLAQELVKNRDLVNLILKAIADKVSD